MRDLGYLEGRDFIIEWRFAEMGVPAFACERAASGFGEQRRFQVGPGFQSEPLTHLGSWVSHFAVMHNAPFAQPICYGVAIYLRSP